MPPSMPFRASLRPMRPPNTVKIIPNFEPLRIDYFEMKIISPEKSQK